MRASLARGSSAVIVFLIACLGVLGATQGRNERTQQFVAANDRERVQIVASLPQAIEAQAVGRFVDAAALDDARSGVEALRSPDQVVVERDLQGCALTGAWLVDTRQGLLAVGEFDDTQTCVTNFTYRAFFLTDP